MSRGRDEFPPLSIPRHATHVFPDSHASADGFYTPG